MVALAWWKVIYHYGGRLSTRCAAADRRKRQRWDRRDHRRSSDPLVALEMFEECKKPSSPLALLSIQAALNTCEERRLYPRWNNFFFILLVTLAGLLFSEVALCQTE